MRALSREVRERNQLNLDNPKRLGTDAFTASCLAEAEAERLRMKRVDDERAVRV